jgi:hypothetical protein
VFDVSHLALNG